VPYLNKIIAGFIVLLLMPALICADGSKISRVPNGGSFSLAKGENALLQFKDFTDRKIAVISTDKNTVILQNSGYARPFFKENDKPDNKGAFILAIGEEARSHETIEMLCIIKLEAIKDGKAVVKITYYSAPPAPEISVLEKIAIQIT